MENTRAFLESESGKELKGFLLSKYQELKNISNVKEYGNSTAQAVELKAQKKAAEKLREILEIIIPITEAEKIDKEKDNYFNLG